MFIHPKFVNLMGRAGVYLEENDGNGNDLPGGETAEAKAAAEKVAADKTSADAADAAAAKLREQGNPDGRKPSDEEAKLLKEVMKRKESEKALQTKADELTAKLKDFEGIDPVAVKKLLDAQKAADEKALEEKGEWDRLKTRMGEEHSNETKTLKEQIASLQLQVGERDSAINEMTVGSSFTGSEFINSELTLTPSKARVIYGANFELEDGKVVGYDKPKGSANRTALVDSYGNPVGFDDALRKIVAADADAAYLLKSGVKPGAQSQNKPVTRDGKNEKVEANSFDKIAAGLKGLKSA
jgi:hypothetical protein